MTRRSFIRLFIGAFACGLMNESDDKEGELWAFHTQQ